MRQVRTTRSLLKSLDLDSRSGVSVFPPEKYEGVTPFVLCLGPFGHKDIHYPTSANDLAFRVSCSMCSKKSSCDRSEYRPLERGIVEIQFLKCITTYLPFSFAGIP